MILGGMETLEDGDVRYLVEKEVEYDLYSVEEDVEHASKTVLLCRTTYYEQ